MTHFDRLKQIAADPGSYGESVEVRHLDGGGAELLKLDHTGGIVLDPDQVKNLVANFDLDRDELKAEVADRLSEHGKRAMSSITFTIATLTGFVVGTIIGFLLF